MTPPAVWLDGRVVAAADALVSVHDRAFRGGEGVFETLRAYGDHPFRLAAHVDRALAGVATLGIPVEAAALEAAVLGVIRANRTWHGGADSAVRLTVSAGSIDPASPFPGRPADGAAGAPVVVATSHPLVVDPRRYETGVTAITVPLARELPQLKSVSYAVALLARRLAHEAGTDEALLASGSGELLEAASANLALIFDDHLVTPPITAGVLAGVTRGVLLEIAGAAGLQVTQRRLQQTDLAAANEAVLTASTREIMPLVRVDDVAIGDGRPGPVAARLLTAYRAEVAREQAAGVNGLRPAGH